MPTSRQRWRRRSHGPTRPSTCPHPLRSSANRHTVESRAVQVRSHPRSNLMFRGHNVTHADLVYQTVRRLAHPCGVADQQRMLAAVCQASRGHACVTQGLEHASTYIEAALFTFAAATTSTSPSPAMSNAPRSSDGPTSQSRRNWHAGIQPASLNRRRSNPAAGGGELPVVNIGAWAPPGTISRSVFETPALPDGETPIS
jgi:hypothetical protein